MKFRLSIILLFPIILTTLAGCTMIQFNNGIDSSTLTPSIYSRTITEIPSTGTSQNASSTQALTLHSNDMGNVQKETPTWTSLPSISDEETVNHINYLYATNGECKLPCWWGINPGVTTVEEVHKEFSSFSQFTYWEFEDGTPFTSVYTNIPLGIDSIERIGFLYYEEEGIVKKIWPEDIFIKAYEKYSLSDFLKLFGEPDEIWILFLPEPASTAVYRFNLLYSELGIALGVRYLPLEKVINNSAIMCPQKGDNFYIRVWEPRNMDLFDWSKREITKAHFKPIDNFTNMDVYQFYQIYQDPNATTCIETTF